jgi:hypothetical protein
MWGCQLLDILHGIWKGGGAPMPLVAHHWRSVGHSPAFRPTVHHQHHPTTTPTRYGRLMQRTITIMGCNVGIVLVTCWHAAPSGVNVVRTTSIM